MTVCVHKRKHLFGEIVFDSPLVGAHLCVRPNRADLLITKWLKEMENKYSGVFIDTICIMPDHVHFIVLKTGAHAGAPLPEMIKWFKTQTTNDYIKGVKNGRFPAFDKHLWQRGYFEHVIRNDIDFYEKRKYISENPIRWAVKEKTDNGENRCPFLFRVSRLSDLIVWLGDLDFKSCRFQTVGVGINL